jgi:hypothetical protein
VVNRCAKSLVADIIISKSSTGKVMNRGPEMMATLIVAAETASALGGPLGKYDFSDKRKESKRCEKAVRARVLTAFAVCPLRGD